MIVISHDWKWKNSQIIMVGFRGVRLFEANPVAREIR